MNHNQVGCTLKRKKVILSTGIVDFNGLESIETINFKLEEF